MHLFQDPGKTEHQHHRSPAQKFLGKQIVESGGLGLLDNRTPPGNVGTMLESEIGSFPPKMKARGVKSHQWIENRGGGIVYMCVCRGE